MTSLPRDREISPLTITPCNSHSDDSLCSNDGYGSETSIDTDQYIVVRIDSAQMSESFEAFGKMDLYVVVTYHDLSTNSHTSTVLGRTPTQWNAGHNPTFEYACCPRLCSGGACHDDFLEIQVFEDDVVCSTLCGSVTLSMEKVFAPHAPQQWKFEITKEERTTGTVELSTRNVLSTRACWSGDKTPTYVDPHLFKSPVMRLGVSGGTAPFFKLTFEQAIDTFTSLTHYVGKDLSRATDEIGVYEELRSMNLFKDQEESMKQLLSYAFEYMGVLRTIDGDSQEVELLVLRNLQDSKKQLRLVDLKMGQTTASANWQGKSRVRAMKQQVLDGWTNSAKEGYRLEGFDGEPMSLQSKDPLADFASKCTSPNKDKDTDPVKEKEPTSKMRTKAKRFYLQNMPAQEIWMHFLELQLDAPTNTDTLSSVEYLELLWHEIVKRTSRLAVVCHSQPVPHKWIGSSLALGYDCGQLPKLPTTQEEEVTLRSNVIVNIFDWGRSEFNTVEKHAQLTDQERADRELFWKYYKGGVDRLAYEVAFLYHHRFGNASKWERLEIMVMDFDSHSADDFIGKILVPVKKTQNKTIKLNRNKIFKRKSTTVTYSMTYVPYATSHKGWNRRLKGSWKVTIHSASQVPSMDIQANPMGSPKNDPYCKLTAFSSTVSGEGRAFCQITSTKTNVANPKWEETFDLPLACDDGGLANALSYGGGSTLVDGVTADEKYTGITCGGGLDPLFGKCLGVKSVKSPDGKKKKTNLSMESPDGKKKKTNLNMRDLVDVSMESMESPDGKKKKNLKDLMDVSKLSIRSLENSPSDESVYYQEWKTRISTCTLSKDEL